jgi:hypothetical protein
LSDLSDLPPDFPEKTDLPVLLDLPDLPDLPDLSDSGLCDEPSYKGLLSLAVFTLDLIVSLIVPLIEDDLPTDFIL